MITLLHREDGKNTDNFVAQQPAGSEPAAAAQRAEPGWVGHSGLLITLGKGGS